MKFAFKFKLPKWERPKPEVPYVSNPLIGELEAVDFAALTAERRRDVLTRIKHATTAVASERRRNPAILTDRIRLQRLWVDYFRIDQTVPPGQDVGAGLSFTHEEMTASLEHGHRAPGALMTTQEELVAQANFKIDMGDMTMDDMDDFDTPPPKLPPRPMPPGAHDFASATGPVHVVTHPESGDSLHIAGLHDLVIEPPKETVAALSGLAAAQAPAIETDTENPAEAQAETPSAPSSDPEQDAPLDANAQAEIVARMRALAQAEAAANGADAAQSLPENPMVVRMRALAAAKAAEAAEAEKAASDPATEQAPEEILTLDLSALSEDETPPNAPEASMAEPPAPDIKTAPAADNDEPPRLSPEEQIRLAEEMRARIKAEAAPTPSTEPVAAPEEGMVARMRKLAQAKAAEPSTPAVPAPALTISLPDDPVEAEPERPAATEESFEAIKSQIVAQTLKEAQNPLKEPDPEPAVEKAAENEALPVEPGMLERLRRLAGLGGTKTARDDENGAAKAELEQKPEKSAAPVPSPVAAEPTPAAPTQQETLPIIENPPAKAEVEAEPEPAPAAAVVPPPPVAAPPAPARPREREASATPSTRDWVNVKLLRPTVIRGLPLPDQVITIVPYPDAKRLEENGSVQILTKPRSPRS